MAKEVTAGHVVRSLQAAAERGEIHERGTISCCYLAAGPCVLIVGFDEHGDYVSAHALPTKVARAVAHGILEKCTQAELLAE